MPSTDAEHLALISDQRSTEFGNQEIVEDHYLFTCAFIDVIEMDILGAPFKVMDEFSGAVALLENEGIVKQLRELGEDINI